MSCLHQPQRVSRIRSFHCHNSGRFAITNAGQTEFLRSTAQQIQAPQHRAGVFELILTAVKLGGRLHWIPSESFRVREAGEAEMKCADVKYFMYCSLIFVAGALHAQAPASGTQASPPPAAPAGVSPPDAKARDPAQAATRSNPLDAAAQLYRTGKLAEAEAAYKRILQNEPESAAAYVGLVHVSLRQKRLPDAEAAI